jgi:undecaprenyl-diphosphatase
MLNKLKNNRLFIFMIIPFLTLILIITGKIINGKELIIDKIAYNILVEKLRCPTMTIFMKNITKLSNTRTIIIIAIILTLLFLFKWKKKDIAILIPCSLSLVTLTNQTLKIIFQRERPFGYRLIEITGYSFPSGHAMVSMAFYGLLIYIIYHFVKNKLLRNSLIIINCLIIFFIGISRVYLGVHYLSDIICGYSISIIYLLLLIKLLKKYKIFP